ncbi:MAG: ABC transporter ATP-binding protein [Pseudomonadales bacterium]|nr:ABC transporter ATP-binding protein [Pseudomonadales bacterium]
MTTALSIKNLQKTYGTGFEALKGIDLEVEQGDFFALLGPNGAGKSTTIGIICSLINKSEGSVEIFGKDIDDDFSKAKKDLGVVPQEFNFSMFEKVIDIVVTQAGFYGLPHKQALERSEHYLRKLGLWDKRDEKARFLSGGMKRRLMIARALVHEPRLLILDEPTAGVDIELRRSMWEFMQEINEAGTTIILTTHYLEEAENLCRNIAIINQGEIVKNTDMRSLLAEVSTETFILDIRGTINNLPVIDGYKLKLVDPTCIEVEVRMDQNLNPVFEQLSQKNIEIASMRNKVNRLEELFVSLVEENSNGNDAGVSE